MITSAETNYFQKKERKFRDEFFWKSAVANDLLSKISDPGSNADSAKIKIWVK